MRTIKDLWDQSAVTLREMGISPGQIIELEKGFYGGVLGVWAVCDQAQNEQELVALMVATVTTARERMEALKAGRPLIVLP